MNCKFCANFVPDGSESCPVCGRRPEEEPIGTLLGDQAPATPALHGDVAPGKRRKRHRKGIVIPLIAILVGVAGWLAALNYSIFDDVKTIWNAKVLGVSDDSAFALGGAGAAGAELNAKGILEIAFVVLVSVIGVYGVFLLLKRLYNRVKYRDE